MNNGSASARMLLVSRESSALGPLWDVSKLNCWELEIASSGWEALERLELGPSPDLVLLDMTPADADGLHTLRWLRRTRPELSVILLSDPGENEQMEEAARLGTQGCLMKPCHELELEKTIKLQLSARNAHHDAAEGADEVSRIVASLALVSDDSAVQKLRARAEQLAQLDVPVLLLGESGNSKEVVARLIHKLSARSGSEFLKVNCGHYSPELLEYELFGSERNGFSGSLRRKQGKLELCHGGTILLDELAEMPVSLQAKILQLLGHKQFLRPGVETVVQTDVRVLAAVNVDVEKALAEKKLSDDLYYRLSPFTVYVPPMKELRKQTIQNSAYGLKSLARSAKGEAEKKAIAQALEETNWNRKAAARVLRISYRALLYKIQQYEMTPPELPSVPKAFVQGGSTD